MLNNLSLHDLVILIVSIIVSMSFHEAMHGFVAHWLGDDTAKLEGRLTLNPLKHIDLYTTVIIPVVLVLMHIPPFFVAKPVPFNPYKVRFGDYGAALVGLAGPLTNLILAALAGLFVRFDTQLSAGTLNLVLIFFEVNVGFFVFNMIPFPPLDGSRVLYAFAPDGVRDVMQKIESLGFLTILLFMFLLFPVISPIIGHVDSWLITFILGQ